MKYRIVFAIVALFLMSCNNEQSKQQSKESVGVPKVEQSSAEPREVNPEKTEPVTSKPSSVHPKQEQIELRLKEIQTALENHQWKQFISYTDPILYLEQKELKISDDQYIYEILNFQSQEKKEYQFIIKETIPKLEIVRFDTSKLDTNQADYIYIPGEATLKDGRVVPISINLMLIDPPIISGANG